MRAFDFAIMILCCLAWAGNVVVSVWALGSFPIPPFMVIATRAAIVVALTFPFLFKKPPKRFGLLLLVCLLVGSVHLACLYMGLRAAPAGASAIVSQMLIPFAALGSVIFLGEKIGRVRGLAIIGAFIGTMIMVYEPGSLRLDIGLLFILSAYVFMAAGSVVMKIVGNVDWRVYVAWVSLTMLFTMPVASALFETGQSEVIANHFAPFIIAAVYSALAVAIFAHGQYFRLIRLYDVTQVVPLTLLIALFATIMGAVFLNEDITLQMCLGALLILPCVYIIARRQK